MQLIFEIQRTDERGKESHGKVQLPAWDHAGLIHSPGAAGTSWSSPMLWVWFVTLCVSEWLMEKGIQLGLKHENMRGKNKREGVTTVSTFSGVLASQGWKEEVSWQKQTAVLTVPWQRTVWKVSREKQEREKGCQAGVGSCWWKERWKLGWRRGRGACRQAGNKEEGDSSLKVLQVEDLDEDLNQVAG